MLGKFVVVPKERKRTVRIVGFVVQNMQLWVIDWTR